jgi:hypothetical protein
MSTTFLLRIAAVISALFAVGHLLGGLKKWSPMGPNPVLESMREVRFDTMGVSRSYLDFFMGFGWSVGAGLLLQSVLLWQLAGLARANPAGARPMIAALALAALASTAISWRFIFPVPAIFSGLLFLSLLAAYFVGR